MTIERRPVSTPPIHPMAALTTIALDGIFTLPELDPLLIPIVSPVAGIVGFTAVTLVQHYLAKDDWGPAIAKGLVMGILAGVPYPVMGTVIGAPLLIWAGLHQWIRLPKSGNNKMLEEALRRSPQLENKDKNENQH